MSPESKQIDRPSWRASGALPHRREAVWTTPVVVTASVVLGMLVGVGLLRVASMHDLRTGLAYASACANSLPFELKLANNTLKALLVVAIEVGLVIPAAMLIARGRGRDQARLPGAGRRTLQRGMS